jgi:hypothetical protein
MTGMAAGPGAMKEAMREPWRAAVIHCGRPAAPTKDEPWTTGPSGQMKYQCSTSQSEVAVLGL